jgi:hypothetical protein
MSMPGSSHFDNADRERLGRALELSSDAPHPWTPDEIAAIYRHELNAPLHVELGALDESSAARVGELLASVGTESRTIGGLLHSREPPVEMLMMLKDFTKALIDHPDGPLPREVAGAIYWSSIAVALARRGQRITSQDDAKLLAGFNWTVGRPWLDPQSAQLLRAALSALSALSGNAAPP